MAQNFTSQGNATMCPCKERGVVSEKAPWQGTRSWTQTVQHFSTSGEPSTTCQVRVEWNETDRRFETRKES